MTGLDLSVLSSDEKANIQALVIKSQQLAGHFPDAEDLDRSNRILAGEVSAEEALAEVCRHYGIH